MINSVLEEGQATDIVPTIVGGDDSISLITFDNFDPSRIVAEYTISLSIVPSTNPSNFPNHIGN